MALRFMTSGESHGPAVVAILEGLASRVGAAGRSYQYSNWLDVSRAWVPARV